MNSFPTREPLARPTPPLWGRQLDEGKSAPVVRFAQPQRVCSFPYHTLNWWELEAGDTETLTIHTTARVITIRGRRLAVIRDALDAGRLELVQQMTERASAAAPGETTIHSITVHPPPGAE